MTTAADITTMNTAIGNVTDAATSKTALQAAAAVAADLNTTVNANSAAIAAALAVIAGSNGGPTVNGVRAGQNTVEAGTEKVAGTASSDPSTELQVPGKVMKGSGVRPLGFSTPRALTDAIRSSAYTFTLITTGGSGAVTFAKVAGAFPSSITLNASTGVISGTSTATAGTYEFVITATDAIGNQGSKRFTITLA